MKDLTGMKFGRLVVVGSAGERRYPCGDTKRVWKCVCECGNESTPTGGSLISGKTTSCGCYGMENMIKSRIRHGQNRRGGMTRTYNIWKLMKRRCYAPGATGYKHYGGRGIGVCAQWRESFASFYDDMGEAPPGLTLDRVDNNGDYSPSNCRWATRAQQRRNTRSNVSITMNGKTMVVQDWAAEIGINVHTLWDRIYNGWDHVTALTAPVRKR